MFKYQVLCKAAAGTYILVKSQATMLYLPAAPKNPQFFFMRKPAYFMPSHAACIKRDVSFFLSIF